MRRKREDRRKLPADLEAFAAGDDDAIWRRPGKRRINDPRPVLLVPGVANRDARAVCDAREKRARAARDAGDDASLAIELAEAARLRVWRGLSVVGWDVWVEEVLELSPERAASLLAEGAKTVGSHEPAPETLVALWMRAEAGLIEGVGWQGSVRLVDGELRFALPVENAALALSGMGRRATPLAKEQAEALEDVVDRPKGVQRLSKVLERPED
ncbi:MAG: hypothetical protein AB8I08_13555 [Sandaracinaceae bacterium]